MTKIALFLLKNCKNRPVLCNPPPAPLSLWLISPIDEGIKRACATTGILLAPLESFEPH